MMQILLDFLPVLADCGVMSTHPKTLRGNFHCAPNHPMPKGAEGRWEHTNAHEVGEQKDGYPGGDIVTMECADCGERWKMELPQ